MIVVNAWAIGMAEASVNILISKGDHARPAVRIERVDVVGGARSKNDHTIKRNGDCSRERS